jgi:hypothetical protein
MGETRRRDAALQAGHGLRLFLITFREFFTGVQYARTVSAGVLEVSGNVSVCSGHDCHVFLLFVAMRQEMPKLAVDG